MLDNVAEDWRDEHKRLNERFDKTEKRQDELDLALQSGSTPTPPGELGDASSARFLGYEEKASLAAYGLPEPDYNLSDVRYGAMLLATADESKVRPHLNEVETKVFDTLTSGAGGVLVPEVITARFIESVRNKTRVLQAGSVVYPMRAQSVSLPGWDTHPAASWRVEGDPFDASGGDFRARTLTAKMVACSNSITIEMLDDAIAQDLGSVAALVEAEQARSIAEAVDLAALIGSGTGGEPLGLLNMAGVTKTPLTAAPADYSFLSSAIGRCRSANFEPNAAIYSARTATQLDELVDANGNPLGKPESVAGISRLHSNQVPDDLGVGTNESLAFVGQFDRLVIGFRPELRVRVQIDPYSQMGTSGSVVVRSYLRADVIALDEPAFEIVSEILP
ncbi:MAG: phage major capsid protein [Vicinamibacteria bacterium]